jgi:putative FmdB family regulatory protein
MPTYEYRCKSCGQHLEVVQAFTDDALTTCEVCGGDLRKVFGNIGITFKGSGFYRTDSRSGSSKTDRVGTDGKDSKDSKESKEPAAKSDSSSKSESSSSSGGSGDSSGTAAKSA